MLQRIPGCGGRQHEAQHGWNSVHGDDDRYDNDEQVGQLGRGVGGAVDGLMRQHQPFDRVHQAVARLAQEHCQQEDGREEQKPEQIGIRRGITQRCDQGDTCGDHCIESGNHGERPRLHAQLVLDLPALAKRHEQVAQHQVMVRVDAESHEQAPHCGRAREGVEPLLQTLDDVHRSASMMRETSCLVGDAPVISRNTPSSDALPVAAISSAGGASAMSRP